MKNKMILMTLIFGMILAATGFGQTTDTIPKDDYSNRRQVDISAILNDNKKTVESTLVIINKKRICNIDDAYFKQLDPKSISNLEILVDEKTNSKIVKIIFITTK